MNRGGGIRGEELRPSMSREARGQAWQPSLRWDHPLVAEERACAGGVNCQKPGGSHLDFAQFALQRSSCSLASQTKTGLAYHSALAATRTNTEHKSLRAMFHMDGVLVDSSEAHDESWKGPGEESGKPFPRELFAATTGTPNHGIIPRWLGPHAGREEVRRLFDCKEGLHRRVAPSELKPMNGVKGPIAGLRHERFALPAGSSGLRADVELALRIINRVDAFDAIVSSEDVRRGEPHPEVFLPSARRPETTPNRRVVFEDAPQGVQAAQAAGTRIVALASTGAASALAAADVVVNSLREVHPGHLRATPRS